MKIITFTLNNNYVKIIVIKSYIKIIVTRPLYCRLRGNFINNFNYIKLINH